MNVAIITPSLHYGGGEKQVVLLSMELKKRGYSVSVFCISGEGVSANTLIKNGIPVIPVFSRFLNNFFVNINWKIPVKKNPLSNLVNKIKNKIIFIANEMLVLPVLIKEFRKSKPDVVHVYQVFSRIAIIAAKMSGIKKIIYTETGFIGYWLSPFQLKVMRFYWKYCEQIIVLSEAMKENMIKLNTVEESKIKVVCSMVLAPDTEKNSKKNKPETVGIVGRLTREKGHIYFLKAAKILKEKNFDLTFIVAGNGYLKKELACLNESTYLKDCLTFSGNFENINDVMEKIDIFVLSSLTEGMPVSIIEAMAYGKPVVATNVGGISELIENGVNGYIVPAKNPVALSDAIEKIINDPKKCLEFGKSSREKFIKNYSVDTLIPEIEILYKCRS